VPARQPAWRYHECLLDLSRETSFAEDCADRNQRPLIMVWGDSTAAALMPGLRKVQETRNFGIAQFTSSSCIPAVGADIAGNPNCRAINDKVLAIARDLKPDIVLLHGTWQEHMDEVAGTVAMLRQAGARVVVLGGVPFWRRGLPSEVLRYYMLRHSLTPVRYKGDIGPNWSDAVLREKLVPVGAEFISAREVLCTADGCLTRTGDSAADISTGDQIHLTAGGSAFLVEAIIGRVLGGK
jgi:hypothetical protein